MSEKREFQSPVSIAKLTQQERTDSETAAQEIVGQLNQILQVPQQVTENQVTIQTPEAKEATIRVVQAVKVPREVKKARRDAQLRLFENAAA